ncbi:MAG: ATP-binding protein [Candidatus Margulisiibacteriota bacterium]
MDYKEHICLLPKETAIERLYVRENFLWKIRWAVLIWLSILFFLPKSFGLSFFAGAILLAGGIAYNAVITFAAKLRYKTSLSVVTFLTDSALITCAVFFSGGINSELWPLYFLLVISSSMIIDLKSEFALLSYVGILFLAATVSTAGTPFYIYTFLGRIFMLGAATFAVNFLSSLERDLREMTERTAMENASLYERVNRLNEELQSKMNDGSSELKRKYAQLEILYNTHKLISSDIELEKILSYIIKGVQEGLGFDRVGIFEIDEQHNIIKGRLGIDKWGKQENIENQIYSMDENDNNFARIAKGKLDYFFTEDADGALPPSQKKYMVPGVGQNMVVPMKARGAIIGMIAVDNLISKKPINEESRRLLTTFADQAATAMHNARMYGIERETAIRLKKLEEVKNDFLSKMSHELKTPLTSIKESIKIILKRIVGEVTPNQEKFLTIAKNNSERLALLISELFDAVNTQEKAPDLELSPIDPGKLIDEVLFNIRPQADDKSISLNKLIQGSLSEVTVRGDYNKLYRALLNLVENSIKYCGPAGEIIVTAADKGPEISISVEDNGIGIEGSQIEKIFDKFYQAHDPLTKYQTGVGLGLSIAKEIVEAHGGHITAQSEGHGKGSKFSFTLPKG